jgi:2-methylcitrate dehydratase
MDAITRKIADYAAGVRFADLTAEVIQAATQRLLDSLGCALGAYNCEPAQIGRRLAAGQTAGKYPGRVLCFAEHLPADAATFINTAMIRNLDFNDRYPGGHPSDCLGALLALAGAMHIEGKRFLAAMIVIYETFARLSDATKLSRRGWDQGYAIAIATAAGLCNLLELPLNDAAHAVGIAATSNLPAPGHALGRADGLEKRGHGLRRAQRRVRGAACGRRHERAGQCLRRTQRTF